MFTLQQKGMLHTFTLIYTHNTEKILSETISSKGFGFKIVAYFVRESDSYHFSYLHPFSTGINS